MTDYKEYWINYTWYEVDTCEQAIRKHALETDKITRVIEYRAYTDLLNQKQESDKVIRELVVVIEKMKNHETFDMHLADLEIINGTLIKAKEHLGE